MREIGTKMATKKISKRDLGEIWITLLTTTMERKATILVTVNTPLKPISKKMPRLSGI